MARKERSNRRIYASPIARTPEPKPQTDPAQFANGLESSTETLDGTAPGESLRNNMTKLQRTVGNRQACQIVRTQGTATIQRLMATEAYLYNHVNPDIGMEEFGSRLYIADDAIMAEIRTMAKQPFWRSLMNAVRIYDLFQNQRFNRGGLNTLRDLLSPILTHAITLDAYIYKRRREWPETLSSMATNLVDDAKQEQQALAAVGTDQTIPPGVTYKQALFVARTGTKFSDVLSETDLMDNPEGESGMPKNFTGGNVSTVTGLTYNTGEQKVFKPNEQKPGVRDDGSKVDWLSAQTAIRALASSRVQDLIGLKMEESGREFTKIITGISLSMYKGQIGTSAEMAEGSEVTTMQKNEDGRPIGSTDLNVDISDIEVQRQLANLQLFDMLTAQSDRNPGNIMISQKSGEKSKVMGIDQDFSFSEQTNIKESIGKSSLPIHVDRYFAEALLAINAGEYRAALKGLPKTSLDAAMTRFTSIQKYLREMAAENTLLVAPGDDTYPGARTWGDVDPAEYRKANFGFQATDYAGRIRNNYKDAFTACKRNRDLKPKQITKGDKQIWVIEYEPGVLFRARNDDGSDLFDLVQAAARERQRERGYGYRGENRPQNVVPGFRLGNRPPVNNN